MNWKIKQAQILETTRRALNAERACTFPPLPDRFHLLEFDEDRKFKIVTTFARDWSLRYSKEDKKYVLEILASRFRELPEEFGQDSFIAVGKNVLQVISIVTVSTQKDTLETFGSASMRPTVKLFCNLTKKTYPE